MKTKHIFSTLFLLMFTTVLVAQATAKTPFEHDRTYRNLKNILNLLNKEKPNNTLEFKDIKGSPYLSPGFQVGDFSVKDKVLGKYYMRYNMYHDEIEVLNGEDLNDYSAFLKLEKSNININNSQIQLYTYKGKSGMPVKGYFIKQATFNNLSYFIKKRCELTPAQKAPNPNQADRAPKFTTYDDYYILKKGETVPEKVELKKKKLLEFFPNQQKEIKTFLKSQKIKLKSKEDLEKLFKYIDSLL